LRRATKVFASLKPGLEEGRGFFRPVLESSLGILAWLHGEFAAASEQISGATAEFDGAERREIDAVWFAPTDPIAMALGVLALDRMSEAISTAPRSSCPGFSSRSGCVSRPASSIAAMGLAADLIDHADRHGFEVWALWGAAQQATVSA
jgi:hypothetical protein